MGATMTTSGESSTEGSSQTSDSSKSSLESLKSSISELDNAKTAETACDRVCQSLADCLQDADAQEAALSLVEQALLKYGTQLRSPRGKISPPTTKLLEITFPLVWEGKKSVREVALRVMKMLPTDPRPDCWAKLKTDMQTKYCKIILNMVETKQTDWPLLWTEAIRFFGPDLHSGAQLINGLLGVLERAYKHPDVEWTRIEAFRCWKILIDSFKQSSLNTKRVLLILIPLRACNHRTEQLTKVKFETYVHLIKSVHATNVYDAVKPFLGFCFSTQGDTMLPLRSYPSLQPLCFEALDLVVRRCSEAKCLPKLTKQIAMGFAECMQLPQVDKEALMKSWAVLLESMSETKGDVNREVIRDMLSMLDDLVYIAAGCPKAVGPSPPGSPSGRPLPGAPSAGSGVNLELGDLLADLMSELVVGPNALSPAQLAAVSLYVGKDCMTGTPALMAVQWLLSAGILQAVGCSDKYNTMMNRLLNASTECLGGPLSFIPKVLKVAVSALLPDSDPKSNKVEESLTWTWCSVAEVLIRWVNAGGELNQGDAANHDFSCLYSVMQFPVTHLWHNIGSWVKVWGQLYQKASPQVALVSTTGAHEFCDQISTRLTSALRVTPIIQGQLTAAVACGEAMVRAHKAINRRWGREQQNVVLLLSDVAAHVGNGNDEELMSAIARCVAQLQNPVPLVNSAALVVENLSPVVLLLLRYPGPSSQLSQQIASALSAVQEMVEKHWPFLLSELPPEVRSALNPLLEITKNHQSPAIRKGGDLLSASVSGPKIENKTSDVPPLLVGSVLHAPGAKLNSESKKEKASPARTPTAMVAPTSTPTSAKRSKRKLEEMNGEFVVIPSPGPVKMYLTEHQKEVLRERRGDIPALYQDLSQDTQSMSQDCVILPSSPALPAKKARFDPPEEAVMDFNDILGLKQNTTFEKQDTSVSIIAEGNKKPKAPDTIDIDDNATEQSILLSSQESVMATKLEEEDETAKTAAHEKAMKTTTPNRRKSIVPTKKEPTVTRARLQKSNLVTRSGKLINPRQSLESFTFVSPPRKKKHRKSLPAASPKTTVAEVDSENEVQSDASSSGSSETAGRTKRKSATVKISANEENAAEKPVQKEELAKNVMQKEESVKKPKQKEEPAKEAVQNDEPTQDAAQKEEPVKQALQKEEPAIKVMQKEEPAKKVVQKEEPSKKVVQKEEPAKKVVQKEEPAKKVVQKEEPAKKVVQKEEPAKKVVQKEEPAKRVVHKEESPKKVVHKEESPKKVVHKEESPKKVVHKEESAKKDALKEEPAKEVQKEDPGKKVGQKVDPVKKAMGKEGPAKKSAQKEGPAEKVAKTVTTKRAKRPNILAVRAYRRGRSRVSADETAAENPAEKGTQQAELPSGEAKPPSEQAELPSGEAKPPSEQAKLPSEQTEPPSEESKEVGPIHEEECTATPVPAEDTNPEGVGKESEKSSVSDESITESQDIIESSQAPDNVFPSKTVPTDSEIMSVSKESPKNTVVNETPSGLKWTLKVSDTFTPLGETASPLSSGTPKSHHENRSSEKVARRLIGDATADDITTRSDSMPSWMHAKKIISPGKLRPVVRRVTAAELIKATGCTLPSTTSTSNLVEEVASSVTSPPKVVESPPVESKRAKAEPGTPTGCIHLRTGRAAHLLGLGQAAAVRSGLSPSQKEEPVKDAAGTAAPSVQPASGTAANPIITNGVSPAVKGFLKGGLLDSPRVRKRRMKLSAARFSDGGAPLKDSEVLSRPGLEWIRKTYQPDAIPDAGILKRRGPTIYDPEESPSNKKKRVSFHDPPVSKALNFYLSVDDDYTGVVHSSDVGDETKASCGKPLASEDDRKKAEPNLGKWMKSIEEDKRLDSPECVIIEETEQEIEKEDSNAGTSVNVEESGVLRQRNYDDQVDVIRQTVSKEEKQKRREDNENQRNNLDKYKKKSDEVTLDNEIRRADEERLKKAKEEEIKRVQEEKEGVKREAEEKMRRETKERLQKEEEERRKEEERIKKEEEEMTRREEEERIKREEKERIKREEEERIKREEEERIKREEEERIKREEEERIKREEEERIKREEEERIKREEEERIKREEEERIKREEERIKREEEERIKREEEERIKREEEERIKRGEEERIRKEEEERIRKEKEERIRKEKEERRRRRLEEEEPIEEVILTCFDRLEQERIKREEEKRIGKEEEERKREEEEKRRRRRLEEEEPIEEVILNCFDRLEQERIKREEEKRIRKEEEERIRKEEEDRKREEEERIKSEEEMLRLEKEERQRKEEEALHQEGKEQDKILREQTSEKLKIEENKKKQMEEAHRTKEELLKRRNITIEERKLAIEERRMAMEERRMKKNALSPYQMNNEPGQKREPKIGLTTPENKRIRDKTDSTMDVDDEHIKETTSQESSHIKACEKPKKRPADDLDEIRRKKEHERKRKTKALERLDEEWQKKEELRLLLSHAEKEKHPQATSPPSIRVDSDLSQIAAISQGDVSVTDPIRFPEPGPVYPALADCDDPISKVIDSLTGVSWRRSLLRKFSEANLCTVGDLATLSEEQVHRFAIRPPRKRTLLQALEKYELETGRKPVPAQSSLFSIKSDKPIAPGPADGDNATSDSRTSGSATGLPPSVSEAPTSIMIEELTRRLSVEGILKHLVEFSEADMSSALLSVVDTKRVLSKMSLSDLVNECLDRVDKHHDESTVCTSKLTDLLVSVLEQNTLPLSDFSRVISALCSRGDGKDMLMTVFKSVLDRV